MKSDCSPFVQKWIWLAIALLVGAASPSSYGQQVAGDSEAVYFIQPIDEQGPAVRVYAAPIERSTALWPVAELRGDLEPSGLVASQGDALLAFRGQSLVTLSVQDQPEPQPPYAVRGSRRALPAGATLRAWGVGDGRAWALVRVEDADLLKKLDDPTYRRAQPIDADTYNRALGLPPGTLTPPGAKSGRDIPSGKAAEPDENSQSDGPVRESSGVEPASTRTNDVADDQGDETSERTPVPQTLNQVSTRPAGDGESSSPEVSSPRATAADRLITLDQGRWVSRPLPEDWPEQPAQAVMLFGVGQVRPTLLVQARGGSLLMFQPVRDETLDGDEVTPPMTEDSDESDPESTEPKESIGWQTRDIGVNVSLQNWDAAVISRQIVLARQLGRPRTGAPDHVGASTAPASTMPELPTPEAAPASDNVNIQIDVIRGDGLQPITQIALPSSSASSSGWTLTPWGTDRGAVVEWKPGSGDEDSRATVRQFDLLGQVQPSVDLAPRVDSVVKQTSGFVLLIGVLGVASVLMVVFWLRDRGSEPVELPINLEPADLLKRGLAGLIDLTPGFIVAMVWSQRDLMTIVQDWPGSASSAHWYAIWPGVVVIAVTVLHTTASELLTARSLGKALLGLRVADLTGRPPGVLRLLGRGLLKPLDMIAVLLLILPCLTPLRQRLAGLVTRTLVVSLRRELPEDDDVDE